jgi:hypothetical protein
MANHYEIERNLRPCPLCGGRAEYEVGAESRDTSSWYYIRCKNTTCGCRIAVNLSGYQPDYLQQHQAFLDRWNTRATDTAEYEGYNAEQILQVAEMLKANEIQPGELMESWQHFKAAVNVATEAVNRKWLKAIDSLTGRGEK